MTRPERAVRLPDPTLTLLLLVVFMRAARSPRPAASSLAPAKLLQLAAPTAAPRHVRGASCYGAARERMQLIADSRWTGRWMKSAAAAAAAAASAAAAAAYRVRRRSSSRSATTAGRTCWRCR